jgi:ABC-type multidrug transport system ATPase subunit
MSIDLHQDDENISSHGFCFVDSVTTKASGSNGGKVILHPMKLDFPENEVTAILGPSGSGKTTLLSVITDNIQSNVIAKGFVNLPGESSFIPQHDVLHGFFTCFSYMKHYARLSGATKFHTNTEIDKRINTILQQLGLTDQAKTIVGDVLLKGLSGGQKRRLSIALEVLSQPDNLFLDEPTSGLDSESALQVMDFLKSYVREAPNRRVIVTIHQPSSFIWSLIDHVILLSKGKLMYNGSRLDMESFYSSNNYPTPIGWNPADHYVTLVNDEFRRQKDNTNNNNSEMAITVSVSDWAKKFQQWQANTNLARATAFAIDDNFNHHKRSPSIVAASLKEPKPTWRSHSITVAIELTYRYFLNLFFNPGTLNVTVVVTLFFVCFYCAYLCNSCLCCLK